jgi:6-pyruvoyltetrahydropterin/6-carboxytetrahydropterin synthase
MEIYKVFKFDAAHRLPNVPAGHKCAQVHGHSFRVEIHVRGKADSNTGGNGLCQPIIDQLDHKYLNDIAGLPNPTSENLAKWIWRHLHPTLSQLSKIIVQESPESGCVYAGEE